MLALLIWLAIVVALIATERAMRAASRSSSARIKSQSAVGATSASQTYVGQPVSAISREMVRRALLAAETGESVR